MTGVRTDQVKSWNSVACQRSESEMAGIGKHPPKHYNVSDELPYVSFWIVLGSEDRCPLAFHQSLDQ